MKAGIRIVICPEADAVFEYTSELMIQEIGRNSGFVLGLPTGETPIGIYRRLVQACRDRRMSFRDVTTFNLDEYVGLAADHPQSYAHYMRRHCLDHVDMARERAHIPNGRAPDAEAEAERYEAAIAARGGIDFMLLGLGVNGHVGFNEPDAAPDSRSRVVTLAPSTVDANSRFFTSREPQPLNGITMGIATILEARRIVLVASGENKAAAVAGALLESPSARCPASFLQLHGDTTFVLDGAAASLLQDRGGRSLVTDA